MTSPNLMGFLALRGDINIREKTYNNYVNQRFAGVMSFDQFAGSDAGDPEKRFYATAGAFGDFFVPLVAEFDYRRSTYAAEPQGLVKLDESGVRVAEGVTTQQLFPLKPRLITTSLVAPTIQRAEVQIGAPENPQPKLLITAENLLYESPYAGAGSLGTRVEDLFVTFEIGGRDTFDTDGNVLPVGGLDVQVDGNALTLEDGVLRVPIPAGVLVGASTITVSRPNNAPLDGEFKRIIATSNPVTPLTIGRYAFVPSAGEDTVTVYDLLATTPYQDDVKLTPKIAAIVPLGVGRADAGTASYAPRKSVVTPDGTRVYVTLERTGEVSVIDAIALQEADVKSDDDPRLAGEDTRGVQPIKLPIGASPFDAAVDPQGHFLFVSDRRSPNVYVIDINPYSPTFHEVVETVALPSRLVPIGLRGLAVDITGDALMVTAPASTIFAPATQPGHVLRVDLSPLRTANTRKLTADPDAQEAAFTLLGSLTFDARDSLSVTEVGPNPYDITVTDEADVYLIVDRSASSEGFGVLRRRFETFDYDFVDLNPFGIIPRLNEGRGTQVFGVRNAQSVEFIPANMFSDQVGQDHPSYAIITGFRKFTSGDPISDPSLGVFDAYNVLFEFTNDKGQTQRQTLSESIVAEVTSASSVIPPATSSSRSKSRDWSPRPDQSKRDSPTTSSSRN